MESTILIISIGSFLISGAAAIYAWHQVKKLRQMQGMFHPDGQPANLEEILHAITTRFRQSDKKIEGIEVDIKQLQHETATSLHNIGLVKFNALEDEGGNLSFSLALLDKEKNGILLTNLSGRKERRLYVKSVLDGQHEHSLSDEEVTAIKMARRPINHQTHIHH